jgi:hypothetical protein
MIGDHTSRATGCRTCLPKPAANGLALNPWATTASIGILLGLPVADVVVIHVLGGESRGRHDRVRRSIRQLVLRFVSGDRAPLPRPPRTTWRSANAANVRSRGPARTSRFVSATGVPNPVSTAATSHCFAGLVAAAAAYQTFANW